MKRLLKKKLIVCLGPGGVGKTTTAAAIAAAGALAHQRVAVITFDPSRRLKDALGLAEFSSQPTAVHINGVKFDALALDTKHTFDALVRRFAPDHATAERILRNRLYQELSHELSGSAEYMAMEKLHELVHGGHYDLIVVDTPPSSHARDLLAAPNRLSALLASGAIKILQAPVSLLAGGTTFGRLTLTALLRALEHWTGMELLHDLADFVSGFEGMIEGFQQRASEIDRQLRGPGAGFVLVTTPETEPVHSTIELHGELQKDHFPVAGIVANRVFSFPAPGPDQADHWPKSLRDKLAANQADLHALAIRDQRTLEQLRRETKAPVLAMLPMSPQAPTTLADIERLAHLLIG